MSSISNHPLQCPRCVMDHTALDFKIEENGYCNYCNSFQENLEVDPGNKHLMSTRDVFFQEIQSKGSNKNYDCIIGLSGGVDSSYVLYLAKKYGFNPLAVHMDNGWNSELSQENIQNLVNKLGVDLYTYVIDWDEYRDLQQAFFNAHVIDIELLYDNALFKINHKLADKYGIRYILSGSNQATEGMQMPLNWAYKNKLDKTNIYKIWKKMGKGYRLKSFPSFGFVDYLYYIGVRRIKWVKFLDYFEYNKLKALEELKEEVGYRPYPYKHYESVFTRFYQGYLLPQKFNADKRKVHLATLIMTNQMSRSEALKMLEDNPYPDKSQLDQDKEYFLKKMGWSQDELDIYLKVEEISHEHYGTENYLWEVVLPKLKKLVGK